jgi:hypothetical protein
MCAVFSTNSRNCLLLLSCNLSTHPSCLRTRLRTHQHTSHSPVAASLISLKRFEHSLSVSDNSAAPFRLPVGHGDIESFSVVSPPRFPFMVPLRTHLNAWLSNGALFFYINKFFSFFLNVFEGEECCIPGNTTRIYDDVAFQDMMSPLKRSSLCSDL